MSQGDDIGDIYRPGSAPMGTPGGPQLSWIERQFKNTNIVVLILGSFCCQPIPLIFGIVGIAMSKDPQARQRAIIMTAISGVIVLIVVILNIAQFALLQQGGAGLPGPQP